MRFKAKVDRLIHIVLAATVGLILWAGVMPIQLAFTGETDPDPARLIIIVLVLFLCFIPILLYIIPTWFGTYYQFDDNCLVIKAGLFKPRKIPYSKIRKATPFRSWWISSPDPTMPVFSFDMIQLSYANPNFIHAIIIAPESRDEFLRELEQRRLAHKSDL